MCGRFSLHVDINTVAQHFGVPATLETYRATMSRQRKKLSQSCIMVPRTWPCCVGDSFHHGPKTNRLVPE